MLAAMLAAMSERKPNALPWEGGCRCNQLRIRMTSAPLISAICHCNGCQKMSSSAFSLTLIFPKDALEILSGEPVRGGIHGPDLRHMFCDHCKTWMFTHVDDFGITNVRATMLDAYDWFVPYLETHRSTKLPWVESPAIQSFEAFPHPDEFPTLLTTYADWAKSRNWPIPEPS